MLDEALDLDVPLAVEWCRTAASLGWRLPDSHLIKILDAMAKAPNVWIPALPVLGERGRWLMTLNPDWARVQKRNVPEDIEALRSRWPEATGAERTAIVDRFGDDHALIRELATTTWKTDSAKTRLQAVEALAGSPQAEDGEFLLSCLGDRSLEVRSAAARGAAKLRIPEFEEEVFALAQEFVQWEPTFSVRVPEMDDKRFERYGMASVKGAVHAYQRQGRFNGLMALIPPVRWLAMEPTAPPSLGQRLLGAVRQTLGAAEATGPARLLRRIPKDGDGATFRSVLLHATSTFGDVLWMEALLDESLMNFAYSTHGMLSSLPREKQEALARRAWNEDGRTRARVFLPFATSGQAWSPDFTRWFIPALIAESRLERPRFYPDSLRSLAMAMDLDAAEFPAVELAPGWDGLFNHWRQVIALRRSILRTLPTIPKP
ncbi:hypothetical protein EON81_20135 [bacterium]|nr:MAG: hypothetical protein EON81_20135 [bacterium]